MANKCVDKHHIETISLLRNSFCIVSDDDDWKPYLPHKIRIGAKSLWILQVIKYQSELLRLDLLIVSI